MKILIAANSQATCLKKAFDANPNIFSQHEIHFYVTPGGSGPFFNIIENKLSVINEAINPKFPPRVSPENTRDIPIDQYDVIIISALGKVDGGFHYKNPITRQGVLASYKPIQNKISNQLLSKSCYRRILNSSLMAQYGVQFLLNLRKHFSKKIIVQPFPLLSEIVKDNPEWPLNIMYEDPINAHSFFCSIRDEIMKDICNQSSANLLPYPNELWRQQYFTPSEFMSTCDGIHPHENYGELVLKQISGILNC